MKRQLVVDRMRKNSNVHQAECERQPLKTIQECLVILYKNLRHEPDYGPTILDGLRQAQKDLDHLVDLAAGNPPSTTRRSSLLRQLASQTEFKAVAKQLIEKAERAERQAEGLRYKFAKQRAEEKKA